MNDDLDLPRLEHELRHALHDDAAQWTPHDRWEDVRSATRTGGGTRGGRVWTVLLTVAATVLAIAVGYAVWRPNPQPLLPGTPEPSASAPSQPAPTPTPSPSESTNTPSPSPTATAWSAPVYYTAPVGNSKDADRVGLFRLFRPVDLTPEQQSVTGKVAAAVGISLGDGSVGEPPAGALESWSGVSVTSVKIDADLITVGLSGPGTGQGSEEEKRLAVQQLVWTAQAALGAGNRPVTFTVADGSTKLQGVYPAADRYVRPSASETWKDLAPIWVITPEDAAVLKANAPITVTGQASVFEGALTVRLEDAGGRVLATRPVQASAGGPERGDWSVTFDAQRPGSYRVVAYALSAEDGTTVIAQDAALFTVR